MTASLSGQRPSRAIWLAAILAPSLCIATAASAQSAPAKPESAAVGPAAGAAPAAAPSRGSGALTATAGPARSGGAAKTAQQCVPMRQLACACPGGAEGVQQCNAAGSAFEPCQCRPPAPPVPSPNAQWREPREAPARYWDERRQPPKKLSYAPGEPIPEGYRKVTRARRGWLIAGAVTAGSLYLISGMAASVIEETRQPGCDYMANGFSTSCNRSTGHRWLYVPVVGPIVAAAIGPDSTDDDNSYSFVLVADGILQGAGIAAAIVAIAAPETVLLRKDIALLPTPMGEGMGLSLSGAF